MSYTRVVNRIKLLTNYCNNKWLNMINAYVRQNVVLCINIINPAPPSLWKWRGSSFVFAQQLLQYKKSASWPTSSMCHCSDYEEINHLTAYNFTRPYFVTSIIPLLLQHFFPSSTTKVGRRPGPNQFPHLKRCHWWSTEKAVLNILPRTSFI